MWSAQGVFIVSVLFGILCDIKQVGSQSKLKLRNTNQSPAEDPKLHDVQKAIDQLHSLSKRNARSLSINSTEAGSPNMYYSLLSNLFQPLMREGFMNDLPKTVVCILSERQDCGPEAELTKAVSQQFGQPLMSYLSLMKSQTCSPLTADGGTGSFFGTYFSLGNTLAPLLSGFQQKILDMLTSLPVSKDLVNLVSVLLDSSTTYVLKTMAGLLQGPMDYVDIALQFGITVPSIDENESCTQGDLKQLIMWGLKHNVSWSFSQSLIDILLENLLPPDQSPYMFPGQNCKNPSSIPLQPTSATNFTSPHYQMVCEHGSLAPLNDTVCADILMGSGQESSGSLLAFCQILSSLSSSQIDLVWKNMCYITEALVVPLVAKSPDCVVEVTQPSPVATPLHESTAAPVRVARDISNRQQPSCNYSSWSGTGSASAALVSLCSNSDRTEFVRQVCNNSVLMKKLLSDQTNVWLYGYCLNSSADRGYLLSQFCVYNVWLGQPPDSVDPALLGFCMRLDGSKLTSLICENIGFMMFLISNPDNWQVMPNCSNSGPPQPFPDLNPIQLDLCQYSQWSDVMKITTDILSQCIMFDQSGFTQEVCANKTFLNKLLLNKDLSWLEAHCSASLGFPTPPPTQPVPMQTFNLAAWCDYNTWGQRQVDDSVVALCWQNDQLAFYKNVCCKASVFQKLLENPNNLWLPSVCTNVEQITLSPQICRYSDWTLPIIVDMTEVALCAEIDPLNFTSKVCDNNTVLQNLLANQDNSWLVKYCANHSGVSPGGGGGGGGGGGAGGAAGAGGGGPTVLTPAVHCQYSSWTVFPPNATLLSQCWEQDQASFISSICQNAGLIQLFSQDLSKVWVSKMCKTYTNYTITTNNSTTTTSTTNNNNNSSSSSTTNPDFCLATNLIKQFNWTCPNSFISDCQPCVTQNMVVQTIVRCWVENLSLRMKDLLTASVTTELNHAASTAVVILLAVEDAMGPIWHVNDTIRQSVLKSAFEYLRIENNQDNKRVLLQCFGTLLSSLLQMTREMSTNELLLIKEYFRLPLSDMKHVMATLQIDMIRLLLQYYNSFKSSLQLSNEYLSAMTSVLLQTQLVKDNKLFMDLTSLLPAASPADIQALPSLQNNSDVLATINRMASSMSLAQMEAFGLWYSKFLTPTKITNGYQSLIRDTGNLIAYLPFQTFQYLSAAQLLDGLDVLQRNALTPLKQEFVVNKLIGGHGNLTARDFMKLGNLTCLADPNDLLLFRNTEAFRVIQDSIMNCTLKGLSMPSQMISYFVLSNPELQVPSALSADRLAELAPLLPKLGAPFLQNLTASQLLAALPTLSSISFTAAQASIIVDKLSSSTTLIPGQVQELGCLLVGVRTVTFLTLTSDQLLSVLKALSTIKDARYKCGLRPPEANAIAAKLWGFPDVVNWLSDVKLLISSTPLLSVMPRIPQLVQNLSSASTTPWDTQQAQVIFQELHNTNLTLIKQDFLSLGALGQGVSCKDLQERFQANPTASSARKILTFLRQQPRLLHTALKSCVIDTLYQFKFFPDLLQDLGAEIASSMSVSLVRTFTPDLMDTVRKTIIAEPRHFLMLSKMKQDLLVDKILQTLGMYTGTFTEAEFRSLGIMAPFVADEVFIQVDRNFFVQNLNYLRSLCYSSSKMELVSRILQEPAVFGPVKSWTQTTISQVERFLFFLPTEIIQDISQPLMTVGRVEKLFISQHQWERGPVGLVCSDQNDRRAIFDKEQFVLQFFLGFLKMTALSPPPMVPTCEILQTTAPSTWTSGSLSSMSTPAFTNCLELMGQDSFLASYQRTEILRRVKKIYGPVPSFPQSVIAQLGEIGTALTSEELSLLPLTERRSIGSLGAVSTWNSGQLTALFTSVLNSTKKSPSQLDSSTLVAMGHIVCGAKTTEIRAFNNVEFGKAVLWLGQLKLSCSEEQMQAMVELLTNSLVFGLMSTWGTDVFIEIGVLTAGIQDIAMSSLVKEQIEGISPMAISLISPGKFAAVFSQKQILMLSYEQAMAITPQQLTAMSDIQKTALALVLNPSESRAVDRRDMSQGSPLIHSPLCLFLGLLMLLTFQFWSDT